MRNQSTIPEQTREFFDIKNQLVEELEFYEQKVYSESDNLDNLQILLSRLWEMVDKNDSPYFGIRLDTFEKLLKNTKEKRAYRKIEFDRMFKVLEKMKQEDSIEFLNEAIKNRIEKISEKILRSKNRIKPISKDTFYLFRYKSLSFLIRNFPKKVLYGVDAGKNFVKIGKRRYSIFPSNTGVQKTLEDISLEYCNILILKVRTEYQCFRFDEMETITDLSYSSLHSKLIPIPTPMQNIKHFIRIRGKRVYYLDV